MKYIYYLPLVLLLFTACGKEEKIFDHEKSDWGYYKVKGSVKSISERSFETSNGVQKGATKHEIPSNHDLDMKFDKEGMLIAEKRWTKDAKPYEEVSYKGKDIIINKKQFYKGNPSLKTDYVYDEKGKNNLSIIRRNADNTPFDKIVMKYKNNKLIERISYNHQQNPTSRITYFYDSKGNVEGENLYSSSDILQYKTLYKYNNSNQKILEAHYNKDGIKDYEIHYTYTGDKRATLITYNGKGEITYREKHTYDNKGNLTSLYSYDIFDGIHLRDEYKYGNNGNKIAWITYKNDTVSLKASYAYDDHGNLTKAMTVDNEGNIIENKAYKYEYDNKGNWIRKIYIKDGIPSIITERSISYFN